jgi:hypothetical protein
MKSLIVLASLGLSSVLGFNRRFLASSGAVTGNVTVTYSSTLDCGACILGGYIFCTTAVEGTNYTSSSSITSTCCETSTGCKTQLASSSYTCSSAYNSTAYAKFMCPFKGDNCGPQNISLSATG